VVSMLALHATVCWLGTTYRFPCSSTMLFYPHSRLVPAAVLYPPHDLPLPCLPLLLLLLLSRLLQSQPRHLSPYHSAWQCAASSIREEGRGVLAKGLGATMGRGFIVNAAIFASFETLSKAMAAA
jgi:hypothetical protein